MHSLAWSPNGRSIASAGLRWVSRVWEATGRKDISVSSGQTGSPQIWSADSRTLFSVALGGGVDRRNATTHERIARFVVPGLAHINTLGLSADGTQIAASGHRQEIFVWSI